MNIKGAFIAVSMALVVMGGSAIGAEVGNDASKNAAVHIASSGMAGGWSAFRLEISKDELAVFNKAIDGLVGVSYTPLAVSSQVVAGMNYQFICNAQVVSPGSANRLVIVHIYAPLPGQGKAHITAINQVTQ